MLFLHGFPEFWYAWKHQLNEFSKDHRAVAVDMRGYNLSEKPDDLPAYRLETVVADVYELARQLSPSKKVTLVGHDWGGYIAWAFAGAHPEALMKLIIINAPHPTVFANLLKSNPAQQKASEYMQMFRSNAAEQILSSNEFDFLVKIMAFGAPNGVSAEDKPVYLKAWSQRARSRVGLITIARTSHPAMMHATRA